MHGALAPITDDHYDGCKIAGNMHIIIIYSVYTSVRTACVQSIITVIRLMVILVTYLSPHMFARHSSLMCTS